MRIDRVNEFGQPDFKIGYFQFCHKCYPEVRAAISELSKLITEEKRAKGRKNSGQQLRAAKSPTRRPAILSH